MGKEPTQVQKDHPNDRFVTTGQVQANTYLSYSYKFKWFQNHITDAYLLYIDGPSRYVLNTFHEKLRTE